MEELALLVESLINTLIGLTVLMVMFSMGLNLSFPQVTALWRKPRKLAKSMLAAVILVPISLTPPNTLWVGGTQLRGDMRVYRVVIGSALLLIGFLIFPFFQESFKITLQASWGDYLIVVLAVIVWAIALKIIWLVDYE